MNTTPTAEARRKAAIRHRESEAPFNKVRDDQKNRLRANHKALLLDITVRLLQGMIGRIGVFKEDDAEACDGFSLYHGVTDEEQIAYSVDEAEGFALETLIKFGYEPISDEAWDNAAKERAAIEERHRNEDAAASQQP